MKYYYINLETATERREQLVNEFTNNNIGEFIRVDALPYSNYTNVGGRLKNAKETACHRSHLKAISEFINNSTDDYAIICEDDLVFEYSKFWRCTPDDLIKRLRQIQVLYSWLLFIHLYINQTIHGTNNQIFLSGELYLV